MVDIMQSFLMNNWQEIMVIFITTIAIAVGSIIFVRIKRYSTKYIYEWIPDQPIKNPNPDKVKKISDYPKNPRMIKDKKPNGYDFSSDSLNSFDGWISGYESFEQSIRKIFLTQKYKHKIYSDKYGVSYNLLEAKDKNEFQAMCLKTAEELIDSYSDYILQVLNIKRFRNKARGLEITLELLGINEYKTINVREMYTMD